MRRRALLLRAGPLGLAVLFATAVPGAPSAPRRLADPLVWTQEGFADFERGRFGDSGANAYVSAKGRIQLINRWDLNNDGWIDLAFANSHPHMEKLDAALYWGDGKDFDDRRVSWIPNEGAQWTVVADLNKDGRLDAVIPNYTNGTWSKMDSFVYYGGAPPSRRSSSARGAWSAPPFARKESLPTEAAQNAAVGDLNRDGWPDIVFALSAGFWEYRGGSALASPSRIFWGARGGFRRDNFLDIEAAGAADVATGDLNRDGWPDIVLANRERAGQFAIGSYLYWGGAEGFSAARRTELPTNQANAVALADVNRDGWLDILFANGAGPVSVLYLNAGGAFAPERRVELPTSDARDCAAADLNGDGFTDLFFTNHQTAGNPLTLSYLYWGGPDGFAPQRRQEFETVGAWGVSLADLNADGRPDIVVSNYREHTSFDVPSYIFWNSPGGFSNTLRTSVFTRGAVGNTVADFNGDGRLDILFNNTIGRTRGGVGPFYIYWGDSKGRYAPDRRLELPSVEPYEWAAGDLNDDGWPDLIIANQAETGRKITENYIYWGGPRGFSESRRTALMGHGSKGVSIADLDRDGWLDVILYNAVANPGVFIYWGGPDGYVTTERAELPGAAAGGAPTIADFNRDGHLDLVTHGSADRGAVIYWGDGTRRYSAARCTEVPKSQGAANSEAADLNRDGWLDLILTRRGDATSLIYYGAQGGFAASRRTELKTSDCQGVTVGDLDKDGWLDIVCPSYSRRGSRATRSRVYRGGPKGFREEDVIELPTNAGTGSQIADYNRDGYNDLLLICHRSEGDPNRIGAISDHVTESFLYWGGRDGFRPDRKRFIPARGAHYDSGVDLGHIYDRRFEFDYISPVYRYGDRRGDRIEWKAQTPFGTEIRFQIRTAAQREALEKAPWTGPGGAGTDYRISGSRFRTPPGHAWIQYRALLTSPNGSVTPVLERVRLCFRPGGRPDRYPPSPNRRRDRPARRRY